MVVEPSGADSGRILLPNSGPVPFARSTPWGTTSRLAEETWRRTCFYASPIGTPDSNFRRHANGMRDDLIRPAVDSVDEKLKVVRGDELSSSPITSDVVGHVENCGLMIADLSFHNPNVFYEVGFRHKAEKACVLVMRRQDEIPANLRNERIVLIDLSDPWAYRAERDSKVQELADRIRTSLSAAA